MTHDLPTQLALGRIYPRQPYLVTIMIQAVPFKEPAVRSLMDGPPAHDPHLEVIDGHAENRLRAFRPSLGLTIQREQMLAAIAAADMERFRYWAFCARG